jgi:hypothetical protein
MRITLLTILTCASLNLKAQVTLTPIGSYHTGSFDQAATEIMAYNDADELVYSTNGAINAIDAIDLSDPTNPTLDFSIDLSSYGSGVNSVAYKNGYVVAAVDGNDPQTNGSAVFFDADGNFVVQVTVGAMPDMICFSPDGSKVLTANEGEPNADYSVDPLGSVSIIDVSGGVANVQQSDVTTLDFSAFNAPFPLDPKIRIFGPGASVAQDLEPEYLTVLPDGSAAIVTLQENNAAAAIDLSTNTIVGLFALGFKDYSASGNGIDASNSDGIVNIQNWPVYGMYQPDAIGSYVFNGLPYVVTANEGDVREYDTYEEVDRIADITLDPTVFPNAATLQSNSNLGRLNISLENGDTDNDGDYDELYSFGARSFSIWSGVNGQLVYDSGDDFEQHIASNDPTNFNSNNDDNTSFDSRSDDKGPEPEALQVTSIMGKTYAFIGLERQGGVMIYDITDPNNVSFESYTTDRDFGVDADATAEGLGPEDIEFIAAAESPTGFPLLLVSNEVGGSISIFSVSGLPTADPLVITEIMYNPPEMNTDSLEFLEIFNPTGNTVDLSGYFFREGFDFTFPTGSSITASGYALVAIDSVAFENAFGIPAWQWTVGDALNNGGEDVVLVAPSGSVADSVNYNDASPWPTDADENGYSMILCDVNSDNNDGANWGLSTTDAGFMIEGLQVYADPGVAGTCMTVDIKEEIITTFVSLYPNPNDGTFQVEVAEFEGDATLGVYNMTGQLLKSEKLTKSGVVSISEKLPSGVYLLKVETVDQVNVQRFVVK